MSFIRSIPALVLQGEFNDESRKHPAFSFLEKGRDSFDARELSRVDEFYTEDLTIRTPHAEPLAAGEGGGYGENHALARVGHKFFVQPYREHKQFNRTAIALQSADGYDIYANMVLFANVEGPPQDGRAKVSDETGREWDVEVPIFYHCQFVRDPNATHDGLRCAHISVIKDTGVVNALLEARGVGNKRSVNI